MWKRLSRVVFLHKGNIFLQQRWYAKGCSDQSYPNSLLSLSDLALIDKCEVKTELCFIWFLKYRFYSPCLWSVTAWSEGRRWEPCLCPPPVSERWSSSPLGRSEVFGHNDPERHGTLREQRTQKKYGKVLSFLKLEQQQGRKKNKAINKINPSAKLTLHQKAYPNHECCPSHFFVLLSSNVINYLAQCSPRPARSKPRASLGLDLRSVPLRQNQTRPQNVPGV